MNNAKAFPSSSDELMNKDLRKWYVDNRRAEMITAGRMCYSPGKFESEPMETLYFYNEMLDGGGEIIEDPMTEQIYTVFEITDDERKFFDFKENIRYFAISESDQGFAYGSALTEGDYTEITNDFLTGGAE